jgi:predicted lipoprotein
MSPYRVSRRTRRLESWGVLALAWIAACGDETPSTPPGPTGPEVMQSSLDNTVVPAFLAFDAATAEMREATENFGDAPAAGGLADLQSRWRELARSWNAVALYNVGPLDDDPITPRILFIESMRQRGTDYTDTVRETYALALSSDVTLDGAYFDALTFNQVGLLALEVLVFEDSRPGRSQVAEDIVEDYATEPRKCVYLRGITDLLVDDVTAVTAAWTESYEGSSPFREVMLESKLPDGREPVVGLLVALQQHLDYVQVRKLEGTLDGQLSGTFFPNVTATLTALEELFEQPTPEEAVGIFDFLLARDLGADVEIVRGNLADAKAAALAEDRAEIPDGLGVDLGINFTDGD